MSDMLTTAAILFGLVMAGEVAAVGRRRGTKVTAKPPVRRSTWDSVKKKYVVQSDGGPDVDDDEPELDGCGAVFAFVMIGFLCYVFYFVMLPAAWGN